MPAYVIANYTFHDLQKYAEYSKANRGTFSQYGGRILVGSTDSKVLDGNPFPITAVIEFESIEAAQRWYDSPEYAKANQIRQEPGVWEGWAIIAPHFEMQ